MIAGQPHEKVADSDALAPTLVIGEDGCMDPVCRSCNQLVRLICFVVEKHQEMLGLISCIVNLKAIQFRQHLDDRKNGLLKKSFGKRRE